MSHDLNRAVAHMDTGVAALGPDGSSGAGLVWGLWVLLRTVLDDRGAQARDRLRDSSAALMAVNRGDEHLARTCRDLLRRAGAPTRRGRGGTPVPSHLRGIGVTTREMDVLALIADGLTNRESAERLFVSARTVETHVANLLTKTGTASRADLRALAAQPLTQ
jgi:DNA-binding NarL/FixJ family response regulator